MEAVGNLARILEANREHAAAVQKALFGEADPPDCCPECGQLYDPDRS